MRSPPRSILVCVWLLLACVGPAAAQDVRPGDERLEAPAFEPVAPGGPLLETLPPLPEVPAFEPDAGAPGGLLPAPEPSPDADSAGLESGARVPIREIRITGNTAIRAGDLAAIAEPYIGRALSFGDVQQLRDDLTRAYVERGFVTSGAVIPTQAMRDGVLEIWIVEGTLTRIDVHTDGRLRESYVRKRLELGLTTPVDVNQLEERLQILQQDERIRTVHAQLVPGERRGESTLRVEIVEGRPWAARLRGNNYSSPTIGGGRGELRASWNNVSGWGDEIEAEYKAGAGLQDVRARYEIPVTKWDTTFDLHFRRTWSEVVESPFDVLDIRSRTETYGFRIGQPLYRSLSTRLGAFLIGEWRQSDSFLFGEPWSFVPGPEDGVSTVAVLRLGGDLTWRARNRVFAARSMLSIGLPILGATRNDEKGVPDAEFVAWLLQLQWAQRFPELWDVQLIARADLQLADGPLFGLEQFAIGGHATVRGYRENRLVRDQGLVASIEARIPVPLPGWREWRPTFELAPFFDVGQSWNAERGEIGAKTLVSAGIGGRLSLSERLLFEVYWGEALRDDGVHLGIRWDL